MLNEVSDEELHEIEKFAGSKECKETQIINDLLMYIYTLKHELQHPAYMYAGARIPRTAIICRNEDIDQLREQLLTLQKSRVTP